MKGNTAGKQPARCGTETACAGDRLTSGLARRKGNHASQPQPLYSPRTVRTKKTPSNAASAASRPHTSSSTRCTSSLHIHSAG